MNIAESTADQRNASNPLRPARAGQVVSRDGTRIAYDQQGSGPPVILIVGALCSRALGPGVKLAPLLAHSFTVFTYDRRGRGQSGASRENAPDHVAREIEDLEALITEAGGSVCAFGHSSGAMLALRAAAHGLPIRKLALYEAPLIVDSSRPSTEQGWRQIEAFVAQGRRGDAVKSFLKLVGVPAFAIALMRWLPVWKQVSALAHTLPHDGALVQEFQKGEQLPAGAWRNVTAPALVIAGGSSPAWMQNGARALAAALGNADVRTLAGQNHDVAPKAIELILKEFFADSRAG